MVSEYSFEEKISSGSKSLIYRASRKSDGTKVILKLPGEDTQKNPRHLLRTIRIYEMLIGSGLSNVIRIHRIGRSEGLPFIVEEDFDSIPLSSYIGQNPPDIKETIRIALQILNGIEELHNLGIIHKDINPSNILCSRNCDQIKITDFDSSSVIENESPVPGPPEMIEGTLRYISPEQTGRMNRMIDYRTDYYSFGITLYEMLTGETPFTSADPLELIHSHLAKEPVEPHIAESRIPVPLSRVVMKLIAKKAEDRYQSSAGIKTDLLKILDLHEETDNLSDFEPALSDFSPRFRVAQKLYGRDSEINQLFETFRRVSEGKSEIILVTGYSGIGKTVLVNEVQKPITAHHGNFISGKFDQYQLNIPFSAIISAFHGLVNQILKGTPDEILYKRNKILSALGINAKVITDVIPDMEKILGEQPEVIQLTGEESQNRFNLVFRDFINVFTDDNSPLVVFLDDLQWADSASLNLLKILLTDPESHHLLIIGAYRENEVSDIHPTVKTISDLKSAGVKTSFITLSPLSTENVNELLSDTLLAPKEKTAELAVLLKQKTNGNPFFLSQLLKSLHSQGLFFPDISEGCWKWEISRLKNINITENVIELLAVRINKLPAEARTSLQTASAIGNTFDGDLLAIVLEQEKETVLNSLMDLQKENIIIESGDNFRFAHDRLQQSAYSVISSEAREKLHLKTGRLLLENYNESQLEEKLFDVTEHFNKVTGLITDPAEKLKVCRLNLRAGKKAVNSIAYGAALNYFDTAISLLDAASWSTDYSLTLDVFNSAVTAAYLAGNFEKLDSLAETVLEKALTILDKIPVYMSKANVCISQNRNLDGIKIILPVLTELGVTFPENPGMEEIGAALQNTAGKLANFSMDDLLNLPEMKDPARLAAMEILVNISAPCYQSLPALFPLVVFEQVNLSLESGNCRLSAFSYMTYAMILTGLLEDFDSGYKFGEMSLKLALKLDARKIYGKILFLFNNNVKHHKVHLAETLDDMLRSSAITMEMGDFEYSSLTRLGYLQHIFYCGHNLEDVEKEMKFYTDIMRNVKQEIALKFSNIYRQTVANLLRSTDNPAILTGNFFDETVYIPENDITQLYCLYSCKAMLAYLFHDYTRADEFINKADQHLNGAIGLAGVSLVFYYNCLIKLALYKSSPDSVKDTLMTSILLNQGKLKSRADHSPENCMHKWHLVEAERCRVTLNFSGAIENYHHAARLAEENKFINDLALIYELTAGFYSNWNKAIEAEAYFDLAYSTYSMWGANSVALFLEKKHPRIRKFTHDPGVQITQGLSVDKLDVLALMNAAQAISGEVILDRLLERIQTIVMQIAGAQKGSIILIRDDKWTVVSLLTAENNNEVLPLSVQLDDSDDIPKTLCHYVIAKKELVLLNNAESEGDFTDDEYIRKNHSKSVLCMPVLHKGDLRALLCLENSLLPGAFTSVHLHILNLLSGQIAVSLENAVIPELVKTKNYFELLFNTNPDPAVITNLSDGRIVSVNNGFTSVMGFSDNEVIGRTTKDLALWEKPEIRESFIRNLSKSGFIENFETNLRKHDGSLITVLISAKVIILNNSQHVLALMKDITYRKTEEELIRQKNQELLKINSEKDKFFSIIAHDLKSPFTGFLNLTEIMAEEAEELTIREFASMSSSLNLSAKNLFNLLKNLLEWAQMQNGTFSFNPGSHSLRQMVDDITETLDGTSKNKEITISNTVENELNVYCDPKMINSVLLNLLTNAIKFTRRGGNVNIEAGENEDGTIRLSVSDNGIGMDESYSDRLFKMGTKVGMQGTEGEPSTGLGLLLCKEFVEKNGGTISVTSKREEGSKFTFTLRKG
ncbi:MAG: AAA family ATPase [Ignavibacteriaceae bacterium]|nr:AAA family ATPase [Ignavibacteriaceae bacterium]